MVTDWPAYFRALAVQQPAEALAAHPAPEVTSEEPMPAGVQIPAVVMKLAEVAREAGWEARITYARGNGQHSRTGAPLKVRDSFAVRIGAHPLPSRQAVAVHEDGSWGSIWIWGADTTWFDGCGVGDLGTYLRNPLWTADEVARFKLGIRLDRNMRAVVSEWKKLSKPKAATGARRESGG